MYRLDNVIESWAQVYRPLSHTPERGGKHKTFYRIDTINMQNEFVRNHNTAASPAMAFSTLVDAEVSNSKGISYQHTIYFMAKQTAPSLAKTAKQDDALSAEIKFEQDEMVQDLLVWLNAVKRTGACPVTGRVLAEDEKLAVRYLDLDAAEWSTIPVIYSGWQLCGLSLKSIVPRVGCLNMEKYNKK
jgi:hypothetical protein